MITLDNAPYLLDTLLNDIHFELYDNPKPPSKQSVQIINNHFGITIPSTLVKLLKASPMFRRWFCSFGTNYSSLDHTIRATSFYKKKRIRRSGHWQYRMPRNFIVLRVGHDEHNLCLDMNKFNHKTGEYGLQYWFPGYEKEYGDSYDSIEEYTISFIKFLINNTSEKIKSECQNIIAKSAR